jgi:PAS domain S-box-containing protein
MPHAACVLDADGRILHVNPAWRTTLGVRLPKPGSSLFLDAVCVSDVSPLAAALERCRAGETPGPVVVECSHAGEPPVPIEWRLAPSSEGRIVAWGRDVSRERRGAAAVSELRMLEDEAERCAGLGSWRLSLIDGGLTWSPEMYRIFGLDPSGDLDLDEVTRNAIHPDDREMIDGINRAVLSDGVPRSSDYRILLGDGTLKFVHAEGRQALDASGRAVALVGFVQDVTEREQAEDSARRSQEQLRMLFDLATEAIFVADAAHRYTDVNAYACEMLGYSREELLAMSMGDLSAPDDVAAQPIRWGVLNSGGGIFSERRFMCKDGSVISVEVSSRELPDGRFLGLVRDITDRKRSEQALSTSEHFLQGLLDATPNLIYIYDLVEERNVYTNREITDFLGYTSEQIIAFGPALFGHILHPDDAAPVAAHHERMHRLPAGDDRVLEVDYRMRRSDGEWRWLHSRDVPFARDGEGVVTQILGSTEDVTESRNAAERLRESEARYRSIIVGMQDAYLRGDLDGKIVLASDAAARMYGLDSPAEMIGMPAETFYADESERGRILEALQQEGAIVDRVGLAKRSDGVEFWVSMNIQFTRDEQGRVTGTEAFTRDISERMAAEQAVRESLSLLQATLESTADGILVVDRAGDVVSFNNQFVELWGVPKRVLATRDDATLIDFVASQLADPASFTDGIARLYAHPDEESFDTLLFGDGRAFERFSRPQSIGDEIVGRVWSFRDVTMRTRGQRSLAESEENLRDAQAIARVGSYVYDIASDVWTSSETMDDIFGIDASYVRDFAGWLALVHEDDREMMSRYFTEEVVGQGHPFDKEYRVTRHADGATVWAHGYGRLEMGADGTPKRMLGAIQDVSVRHEMEAALQHTNRSLERMVYDVAEAMGRVVEIRDQYTKGHQERTSRLAKAIAIEMGLPRHDVAAVEMAAVVHDIGKLSVPAEILSRPTKLSELEMSLVREHPNNGYQILKDIPFPWPVAEIVLQHHERLDGSGYPLGLRGDQIVPLARVLAVADVVEAMATHRPYRPALGVYAAITEIRQFPEKYDAAAVEACCRLYERGELDL